MGPEMGRFFDRKENQYCLSPTHEEVVCDVFRKTVNSYKQLPTCLYHINPKFRDEIRPRFGLMRSREFLMMDAYSFHSTQQSLDSYYDEIFKAYQRIYSRTGVSYEAVEASVGEMGGDSSHEFHVLAETGEDEIRICDGCSSASNSEIWASPDGKESCPKCKSSSYETIRGIEVGHIFKLGTKYTESMGISLTNEDGKQIFPIMGCYGIGVSRLMASVIEQNHDDKGMKWPAAISPIDIHIISTGKSDCIKDKASLLHKDLSSRFNVYWDDRNAGFGQKIKDFELFGFPFALVIGREYEEKGIFELIDRSDGSKIQFSEKEIDDVISRLVKRR